VLSQPKLKTFDYSKELKEFSSRELSA